MTLEGRHALVTGAARGIGRAVALVLAREGADLALLDRDGPGLAAVAAEVAKRGRHATQLALDLSEPDRVHEAVTAVADTRGFSIVVNNAAAQDVGGTVSATSPEDWNAQFAVNLRAAALVSRAAIPGMERMNGGCIVNVASISGLVGLPNQAAYAATKGGLVQLTRAMAVDHGPSGIRVVCVCPGPTYAGPLLRGRTREEAEGTRDVQALLHQHPLRRLAEPEDIAEVVVFLVGPGARHVTGVVLPVDGGYTAQ